MFIRWSKKWLRVLKYRSKTQSNKSLRKLYNTSINNGVRYRGSWGPWPPNFYLGPVISYIWPQILNNLMAYIEDFLTNFTNNENWEIYKKKLVSIVLLQIILISKLMLTMYFHNFFELIILLVYLIYNRNRNNNIIFHKVCFKFCFSEGQQRPVCVKI